MATYDRINSGKLLVDIVQGEQIQTYGIEMGKIKDNAEAYLIFHTDMFQPGELAIRFYSYDSTGDNCVALYTVSPPETYSPLLVNGEQTEQNAVMQLYVPSAFAKSDFNEL
jgi:hypothetical protein